MSEKKLLKIMLGLLIAVLLHNLYLNYEILQVKEDAERARRYASEAADYAKDAAYDANTAAANAFLSNCRNCP